MIVSLLARAVLRALPALLVPVAAAAQSMRLEGRVVDLRGEPVPAAEVWVTSGEGAERWWHSTAVGSGPALARTVADGEGCFVVAHLPDVGPWDVHATAPGRSRGRMLVRQRDAGLVLRLHDAAAVHSVLRDRSGRPVAGAVVQAWIGTRVLQGVADEARTGDDGGFVLAKVPFAPVTVQACVPGEGIARMWLLRPDEVPPAFAPTEAAVGTLRIHVAGVDADDLASIRLELWADGQGMLPPPCSRLAPDRAGNCVVEQLPAGKYSIYPSSTRCSFASWRHECDVHAGEQSAEIAAGPVRVPPRAWPGRLQGADGEPIAGARLALLPVVRRNETWPADETVTGTDGEFRFECDLPTGTKAVVQVLGDRLTLDQAKPTTALPDLSLLHLQECEVAPDDPLELRAELACEVRGRLLRPDGRPAAVVEVQLEEQQPNRTPEWSPFAKTVTGRDGTFVWRGLHRLDRPVRLHSATGLGAVDGAVFALAAAGAKVDLGDLRLERTSIVEGVVHDAAGAPAPGVRVWLREWDFAAGKQKSGSVVEVLTDRAGRYRFTAVPPGGTWLQVLRAGESITLQRAVEPFEVKPGETSTFVLTAPR